MILIGLCGPKGVGKSTVAAEMERQGFERLSYATPIKRALSAMFGVDFTRFTTEEKEQPLTPLGLSPRRLMQTLGTEWGRAMDPDIWLKLMRARLEVERRPNWAGPMPYLVIDDVRFDNEAALVKEMGGVVLMVTRSGFTPAKTDRHSSERGVCPSFIDGHVRLGRHVYGTAPYNGAIKTALLPYLR